MLKKYKAQWSWASIPLEVQKARLMNSQGLTEEEADLVFAHVFPKAALPDPHYKIREILTVKFKENGFNQVSSRFAERLSFFHIPTRFYDTVIITASQN